MLNGGMNDTADLLAQIDELHRELAAEKAENAALKGALYQQLGQGSKKQGGIGKYYAVLDEMV